MTSLVLSAPHFHNEDAAFAYVEAQLWPNGPICPHCGATGDKIGRLTGKMSRPGPPQVLRLPEALYCADRHDFRG